MNALYRKRPTLPSLLMLLLASGCDSPPPSMPQQSEAIPGPYLEALQEVEALKHSLEQRKLEQQRIDGLLGRAPTK